MCKNMFLKFRLFELHFVKLSRITMINEEQIDDGHTGFNRGSCHIA